MLGHRPSSLDIAQYCAASPPLNETHGAGRAAIISRYFHAKCAGKTDEATAVSFQLTPEELEECGGWVKPADVEVNGVLLKYEDADRELEVGLTQELEHCAKSDPLCVTGGTLDFAWSVDKVAFVADIKKSRFTVETPRTLQNSVYGFSYASLKNCHSLVRGIWVAEEGFYMWDTEVLDLYSSEAVELGRRILFAALHKPEPGQHGFQTGGHCSKCYNRPFCTEYLLPSVVNTNEALAPLSRGVPTRDEAYRALRAVEALKVLTKAAETQIKEYARREGIRDGKGWVYLPVTQQGKRSVSVAKLKEALGSEDDQYFTKGDSFERYQWVRGT